MCMCDVDVDVRMWAINNYSTLLNCCTYAMSYVDTPLLASTGYTFSHTVASLPGFFFSVLSGESLLNDGTAIVMFTVLLELCKGGSYTGGEVGSRACSTQTC